MEKQTLFIYLIMYAYGFSLMTWAIFFDKHPTKKSVKAAKIGIVALLLTVLYVVYVLWKVGLT